jgi:hypothetical protein
MAVKNRSPADFLRFEWGLSTVAVRQLRFAPGFLQILCTLGCPTAMVEAAACFLF